MKSVGRIGMESNLD